MNIDKRWYLLLAAGASVVAGVAVASQSRRRSALAAHDFEHGMELKSWEDEGGNLAPSTAPPAPQ